jgi:hypothetical protein
MRIPSIEDCITIDLLAYFVGFTIMSLSR